MRLRILKMDHTAHFYSKPSYIGAGVIFSGARRQRGGSILGALKSVVLPIVKRIGRSFGRVASKNALGLATDVLHDTISGRNIKDSIINRGKNRLFQTANEGLTNIGSAIGLSRNQTKTRGVAKRGRRRQRGSGVIKRCNKSTQKKKSSGKRSQSRGQSASRKRRAPRGTSSTPKSKQRRTANF